MKPTSGMRKFMIVLASIVCVFYLAYRAVYTFNLSTPYAIFASVFLYIGELFGIVNLLLYFLQVWDVKEPPMMPVIEGRTVDVFVPTYNEDPQLLRSTLEACIRMDYPHRTYVLDDGRRPEVAALANELGVTYITRQDNRHAKAGNLNNAFEQTDAEFVVILDADHVPEPHFITRLIGYFADERVGFVQTPHAFYNFDSFQAQLNHRARRYWEEGDLFYRVIQPGRNHWNAPIFAGSAAMFRRSALRDIGYIAVETITEDLHTGLRMHSRGWRGLAITERLIAGQAAPDITTFHAQRLRWGEGNLSIMAYDNPLTMRGLTMPQRLCYFGSMIHWASGVFKLAIYTTPILMLFTGVPPVREFTWTLAIITLFYLFISLMSLKIVSNGYGAIFNSELFSMVNFWTQVKATFRALFRRRFQKFVVTPKRSVGQRSVWPYIRPQTYLIIAGVLALFWGWSRLFMGISDDKFKSVVPTFWVMLHIILAYMVTRRAFWPADKRFSTRHFVHLPVEYEAPGKETTRYGVTLDLNDSGMALIAYERLPLDREIRLMMRGAGEVLKIKGEIRSATELIRGRTIDGYRYGIAFKNLTTPQIDAINRICMQYAVPRMYAEYDKGNRNTRFNRFLNWQERGMSQRRGSHRYPYHLPLIVNPGTSEETACFTATEDISRDATASYVDVNIPPNSLVGFMMPTPLGDIRGIGRVVRSQPQFLGGRTYYRTILEFQDFEGQGRTTLHSLVNPAESAHLDTVLRPDKKPMIPRMGIPILIIAIIAGVMVLAQMGVFRFVHRDDFKLREMLLADTTKLTEAQRDDYKRELNRIYNETYNDPYPTTDRLVLVLQALAKTNPNQYGGEKESAAGKESASMIRLLASRDAKNLELQSDLPSVLEQMNQYKEAEEEYKRLQEMEKRGDFKNNPGLVQKFTLAAARVAYKSGDLKTAAERFDTFLKNQPDNLNIRTEYAGVLISAKEYKKAAQILKEKHDSIDTQGRKYLIAALMLDKNHDEAEKEAKELPNQSDPAVQQILADVYSAKQYYGEAQQILEKLLKQDPNNPELLVKMARSEMAFKMWDKALARMQGLLDKNELKPEYIEAWVDAASSSKKKDLTEANKKTAQMIYDKVKASGSNNPVFLARLGWVLNQMEEPDKSRVLLEQALALTPADQSIRDQLAGVLIDAGEWERAIVVMGGTSNLNARRLAIGVYIRKGELDKAEKEAQAILDQNPGDLQSQKLVADILSWKKEWDKSIGLYEKMRAANPDDLSLLARLAEINLWKGNYPLSVAQFTQLLDKKFDFQYDVAIPTQKMWDGFIDAAAGVGGIGGVATLDTNQSRMAMKIAAAKLKTDSPGVVALSRLAWVLLISADNPEARELADQILTKAVAMKPTDPVIREELAGVLAKGNRFKDAIAVLEGLPLDENNRTRLAFLYSAFNKFDEAEKQVDALLVTKPTDLRLLKLKADLMSWRGTPDEQEKAIATYEKLMKEFPNDPDLPVRQAEVMLWKKDYELALTRFQSLLSQYPENPQIWAGFATAAASTTRELSVDTTQLAKRILESAFVTTVNNPLYNARLAMLANKLHDTAKRDVFVTRAINSKPTDPIVRKELASLLIGLDKAKEAIKMYEGLAMDRNDRKRYVYAAAQADNLATAAKQARILVDEDPKDRSSWKLLADVLSWKADYQESLTIYERLLRDSKNDRSLKIDAANVKLWMDNYPAAVKSYGELLIDSFEQSSLWEGFIDAASSASLSNRNLLTTEETRLVHLIYDRWATMEDPLRLSRMGWVMYKLGDLQKANAVMTRALALTRPEPSVRKELAGVLAALGRNKEALDLVQDIKDLNYSERTTLAALLSADSRFNEAELQLRNLAAAKPNDPELQRQLGNVLLWNGKYREAEAAFSKVLLAYPNDQEIPLKMAQAALWSGNPTNAVPRFQELLAKSPDNPEVISSYVEALAGLKEKEITPEQEKSIRSILSRLPSLKVGEPKVQVGLLSNMGRILAKLSAKSPVGGEADKAMSKKLFLQALAMKSDRTTWQRYAQSLYDMKEYAEAEQILGTILNGELPSLPRRNGN